MSNMLRKRAYVLGEAALVVAGLGIAVPLAQADAPFRATMQEQFALGACPVGTAAGMACATGTGSGKATHMGRTSETIAAVINMAGISPATGCTTDTSTTTLTAANGDRLIVMTTGNFCLGAAGAATDTGTYVVIGGTGRLAAARGQGTYTTQATFGAGGTTGASVSTYEGSLTTRHGGTPEDQTPGNDVGESKTAQGQGK